MADSLTSLRQHGAWTRRSLACVALIVLLAPTAAGAALLAEPDASAVRQLVLLRDRKGRLWMATYVLERQTAAGWRISGCVVAVDSGKSST